MRYLYKTVKVIHDGHLKEYQVWYRNWFFWKYESCYKYDTETRNPTYYRTVEQARDQAIKRAEGMLGTVEIWKKSNFNIYV